jgi:hypothetical protein
MIRVSKNSKAIFDNLEDILCQIGNKKTKIMKKAMVSCIGYFLCILPCFSDNLPPSLDCDLTFTSYWLRGNINSEKIDEGKAQKIRIEFPSNTIALIYNVPDLGSPIMKKLLITDSSYQLHGVIDAPPEVEKRSSYYLRINRVTASAIGEGRMKLGENFEHYTKIFGNCNRAELKPKF